jgi:hypothetical protein
MPQRSSKTSKKKQLGRFFFLNAFFAMTRGSSPIRFTARIQEDAFPQKDRFRDRGELAGFNQVQSKHATTT